MGVAQHHSFIIIIIMTLVSQSKDASRLLTTGSASNPPSPNKAYASHMRSAYSACASAHDDICKAVHGTARKRREMDA